MQTHTHSRARYGQFYLYERMNCCFFFVFSLVHSVGLSRRRQYFSCMYVCVAVDAALKGMHRCAYMCVYVCSRIDAVRQEEVSLSASDREKLMIG